MLFYFIFYSCCSLSFTCKFLNPGVLYLDDLLVVMGYADDLVIPLLWAYDHVFLSEKNHWTSTVQCLLGSAGMFRNLLNLICLFILPFIYEILFPRHIISNVQYICRSFWNSNSILVPNSENVSNRFVTGHNFFIFLN